MNSAVITWFLTVGSVAMIWLMGNGTMWGPIIGLVNQFAWTGYAIVVSQETGHFQTGLIVQCVLFFFVHARNLIKWHRERKIDRPGWPGFDIDGSPIRGIAPGKIPIFDVSGLADRFPDQEGDDFLLPRDRDGEPNGGD